MSERVDGVGDVGGPSSLAGKRQHQYNGLFVTVDGPNGVGKTTLVHGVVERLRQLGRDVHETSEPTASELGRLVRQSEAIYSGRTYACFVAADRYFHLDNEIMPALEQGKIVLSSRYVESSLVLQRLDGVPIDFIWELNSQVQVPDLSIVLTASPEILEQRLAQRSTHSRFELTTSRSKELEYYLGATAFLTAKGFNTLTLDNGNTSAEANVQRICGEIASLAPSG